MAAGLSAIEVWVTVPIATKAVTVTTNNDKTGYSGVVTDKTGFSLTAGSYAITGTCQRGTINVDNTEASDTLAISSVTTAKTLMSRTGANCNNTDAVTGGNGQTVLTSSTVVTGSRDTSTSNRITFAVEVAPFV